MPATADRDEIILRATETATTAAQKERAGTARNYESEQSMRIAQSTISSLQVGSLKLSYNWFYLETSRN